MAHGDPCLALAEPCVLSTGQTAVTIGEPTAVCIVVNNLVWEVNGTSKYSQVLITPDADDFSRFSISGCEYQCTPVTGMCIVTGLTELVLRVILVIYDF